VGESSLQAVSVRVCTPGATRQTDREALLAFVAEVTGADPASTALGRRCPHCRGTDHGRPWAIADGRPVGVSLSRTDGALALAVGPAPLGVDVERVTRVAAAPLDASTPGERVRYGDDQRARTACWSAKEAVLKRDGRGLRVDPATVDVDLDVDLDADLDAGTAALDGVRHPLQVHWLDDDLVLAVAAGGVPIDVEDARPGDRR